MSTVVGMADLPFGFSAGNDPDRDKDKKDPDSGSGSGNSGPGPGSDPFGFGMGGANFDMGDLGQIFTKLGEMFSGAGSAMGGKQSGPVNYDLARQLASNSIGFVAPVPEKTSGADVNGGALVLQDLLPVPDGMTAVDLSDGRRVFAPVGTDPEAVRVHVAERETKR